MFFFVSKIYCPYHITLIMIETCYDTITDTYICNNIASSLPTTSRRLTDNLHISHELCRIRELSHKDVLGRPLLGDPRLALAESGGVAALAVGATGGSLGLFFV